jgi:hypothetical protein
VTSTDIKQFEIKPRVTTGEVTWLLELDWTCGKRAGTTIIDDDGNPSSSTRRRCWVPIADSIGAAGLVTDEAAQQSDSRR